MKKQTKNSSRIREKKTDKDYAGTEASPYREWLDNRGDYNQEHEAAEPAEANPDVLPESAGLYHQAETDDDRMDFVNAVIATLTDKQKEILRLCGNEGRTIENTAAILNISRGAVQTTLNRIRKKVKDMQKAVLQNNGLSPIK